MSEVYILEVHKTPERKKKPLGRRYEQRGAFWRYVGGEKDTARRERKLQKKGYRTYRYTDDLKRGSSYRAAFFNNTSPDFFGFYTCAYCGKKLSYSKVTVDHLIPVGAVKRDEKLKKKLHGKSVNDPSNLVASCLACNQKKGMDTGKWIRKGRLGRHPFYFRVKHFLTFLLVLAVALTLFYLLCRFYPQVLEAFPESIRKAPEDFVRFVDGVFKP